MPSPEDLLAAFSQVQLNRWGTPARVLAYLGQQPEFNGARDGNLRDMAAVLRLSPRTVRDAFDRLEADGVIVVRRGRRGSASVLCRIREPEEWGAVPWRGDRRDAALTMGFLARARDRARDAVTARDWDRARRLVLRGLRTAQDETVLRGARTAQETPLRARGQDRARIGASLTNRFPGNDGSMEISLSKGASEVDPDLSTRIFAGVLVRGGAGKFVTGAPRNRLAGIVARIPAERFDEAMELCSDPEGPATINARLDLLEDMLASAHVVPIGRPSVDPTAEYRHRERELVQELSDLNQQFPDDPIYADDRLRSEAELDEVRELLILASEHPERMLEA